MPRSDQETVLQALEHARRIVGQCIAAQSNRVTAVINQGMGRRRESRVDIEALCNGPAEMVQRERAAGVDGVEP